MNKKEADSFSFSVYNLPALKSLEASEEIHDEDKEKVFNQIINKYTSSIDQIPDACKFIRQLKLYEISYKEEEERLSNKRKRIEAIKDKLENALITLIEKSDSDSINSGLFDISIRNTIAVDDDYDLEQIDNEYKYIKTEIKIDKMKIKNDYKLGKEIKGVKLLHNKHLIIK